MESRIIHAVPARPEPALTQALITVEGASRIREDFPFMLSDESRMPGGTADRILFPSGEFQISEILRELNDQNSAVTVSGGRTGIVGGAVPQGGSVLTMEKCSRFTGARWDEDQKAWCVRVEPGMTVGALGEILKDGRVLEAAEPSGKPGLRFQHRPERWIYPVDPTESTAQIGGTVATNASGSRSLRFGPTRTHVSGLRVVLMDGSVLDLQRGQAVSDKGLPFRVEKNGRITEIPAPSYPWPTVKNAAGYCSRLPLDLLDLFIGSEGTLGVVSEIELKLSPKPEAVFGGIAFFQSESDAVRFVHAVQKDSGVHPLALEFFDAHGLHLLSGRPIQGQEPDRPDWPAFPDSSKAAVFFEQAFRPDGLDACLTRYGRILDECGGSMDDTWGASDDRELEKMAEFRHALPEIVNSMIGSRKQKHPGIHKISTDFAVPESRFDEMLGFYRSTLDAAGLEYLIFGHIGESHVHINILPDDEQELFHAKLLVQDLARKAVSLGGTISAEHGIGKLKKDYLSLQFSKKSLESMRNVKKALDPRCLLGRETLIKAF